MNDFDACDTDKLPPPLEDTGPISAHDAIKAQAAISIRDAFEQLAETQKAMELAEYKTHLALGMAADDEAQRVPTRMERIESKLDALTVALKDLADNWVALNQDIVHIKHWQRHHIKTDNHCDNCEFRASEAKEA